MKQLFKSKFEAAKTYFGRRDKNMINFHNAISDLARNKWEEAGKPEGLDLEFWLSAESELWNKFGNKIPGELA
jgi:hypothetical protein